MAQQITLSLNRNRMNAKEFSHKNKDKLGEWSSAEWMEAYKDHVLKQVGKDIKQKYIENERNGLFPIMEINETQEIISKHISE